MEIVSSEVTQYTSKASFSASTVTLLKISVGSGILSLPYTFSLVGYIGGSSLLIFVALLNYYSWRLMI